MNVTVKESIVIDASPDAVWDFTQDWTRRALWDPAIISAELLSSEPRELRARTRGGTFVVRYKLYDRPRRTSLAMTAEPPGLLSGGGGSWDYAPEGSGTRFTQQNTLVVRGPLAALLGPAMRWQLRRSTRAALANAKRLIEQARP